VGAYLHQPQRKDVEERGLSSQDRSAKTMSADRLTTKGGNRTERRKARKQPRRPESVKLSQKKREGYNVKRGRQDSRAAVASAFSSAHEQEKVLRTKKPRPPVFVDSGQNIGPEAWSIRCDDS